MEALDMTAPLLTWTNTAGQPRSAIPVISRIAPELSAEDRARLASIATRLSDDEPALSRSDVFGPLVAAGYRPGPALLFGDQREIRLHAADPEQALEHRIALLASSHDTLMVERESPAYQDYLRGLLGLEDLQIVSLGPPRATAPAALPARCLRCPELIDSLACRARQAGALQLIPHIGLGSCWRLAQTLAERASVPVSVAAPPPRLTRRVNDKIWFAALVRKVIGPGAVPPSFAVFGPSAIAARLVRLARRAEKLVVKVPDSAGSLGNVALPAEAIRGRGLNDVRALVLRLLRQRGWDSVFPVLVGVWDTAVLSSPSVQLWIPRSADGDPVIEGIFEQKVSGAEATFVGATLVVLPTAPAQQVAGQALRLAIVLQRLGYFGRCSFDALLVGQTAAAARLHWVECNGRWGGVSLPMTFANRFFETRSAMAMTIVQDMSLRSRASGVADALARLSPVLLRRGDRDGVLPLSAGVMERPYGAHFAAFAGNQRRANDLAARALELLCVLPSGARLARAER